MSFASLLSAAEGLTDLASSIAVQGQPSQTGTAADAAAGRVGATGPEKADAQGKAQSAVQGPTLAAANPVVGQIGLAINLGDFSPSRTATEREEASGPDDGSALAGSSENVSPLPPAERPNALSVKAISSLAFLSDPVLLRSLSASPEAVDPVGEISKPATSVAPLAAAAPASLTAPGAVSAPRDLASMTLMPTDQQTGEAPTAQAAAEPSAVQEKQAPLAPEGKAGVLGFATFTLPSAPPTEAFRPSLALAPEIPSATTKPFAPGSSVVTSTPAGKLAAPTGTAAPSIGQDDPQISAAPFEPKVVAMAASANAAPALSEDTSVNAKAFTSPAVASPTLSMAFPDDPPLDAKPLPAVTVERQASVQPAAVAGRMAGAALMASAELIPLSRSAGNPIQQKTAAAAKVDLSGPIMTPPAGKIGAPAQPQVQPQAQPQPQILSFGQMLAGEKITSAGLGLQSQALAEHSAAPMPPQGIHSLAPELPGSGDTPLTLQAASGTQANPVASADLAGTVAAKAGAGLGPGLKSSGAPQSDMNGAGQSAPGADLAPGLSREGFPTQIHHAPAPSHSSLPQALALPQAVATQVARQLQGPGLTGGTTRISLSDESLGELVIELETDDAGQLRILLKAENPALLSTIRADRDTLLQSLNQAGVSVDERGLGFEDLGQRGRDGGNTPGRRPDTMPESLLGLDDEPLAPVRTGPIRLTAELGRLDILT